MRPLALLSLTLLPSFAAAQTHDLPSESMRPRWIPTKSLAASRTPLGDPHRIVLKVADDAGARAVDGRLAADPLGRRLDSLLALLQAFPGVRVERLVELPDATLRALRERGQARLGEQLADMTQYFELAVPEGLDADALLAGLLVQDAVENAYVQPAAEVAGDVGELTPDFTASQGYRFAAPEGIDAFYADGYSGGGGSGQTIVDIEWGWRFTHEDLSQLTTSDVIGAQPTSTVFKNVQHGTAVVGAMSADRDAAGVTGIAPEAELRVASVETAEGWVLTQAILASANALSEGDVILIEVHAAGPNSFEGGGQFGYLPVEYWDAPFNAIRTATANGIHVVEAGGNGSQDLDSTVAPDGDPTFPDRFWLSRRDSGALMVGAGASNAAHAKLWFTNHGSRIDAFAWGENVTTTGYGAGEFGTEFAGCNAFPTIGGDYDQYYTHCFNGTSSASPIVAAAVAIINAVHRDTHGIDYSVPSMRGLLRTVGTPSVDYGISRQPNLRAQLPRVGGGPLLQLYHLPDELVENLVPGIYPDLNGDGVNDWFVGQFEDVPDGLEPQNGGSMRMFDGVTGEEFFVFEGLAVGDDFGTFVLPTKDFDGDGLADALVGAPGVDGDAGAVYLLSPISGEVLMQSANDKAGERFGSTAIEIGDWDGDGAMDFAVGAPLGDPDSPATGRVVGISGATGDELWHVNGEDEGERFGTCLVLVDDYDGNGYPDLAVGAPGNAESLGRIAIIALEDLTPLVSHKGPDVGSRFGESMVPGPDMDGDGKPDLFVGAPGEGQGVGALHRVTFELGDLGIFYQGGPEEEEMPLQMALTPDHDGDGFPDLLLGAPGANGVSDQNEQLDASGAVYLVSSVTGLKLGTYTGTATGNRFGRYVAGGSLDGQGPGDVLVGAGGAEGQGLDRGAAYLFAGGPPAAPSPSPLPSILTLSPSTVPAVTPDEPLWIDVAGDALDEVTRVTIGGVELRPDEVEVTAAGLRVAMPLVDQLGSVPMTVETLGGSATESLVVIANPTPALDVRPRESSEEFLPGDVTTPDQGVVIIIGSQPGELGILLLSASDQPTVLPGLFELEIGNGLQSLFTLQMPLVPAKGWVAIEYPTLPDKDAPYALFFQAVTIDPLSPSFPLADSNAQALTIGS